MKTARHSSARKTAMSCPWVDLQACRADMAQGTAGPKTKCAGMAQLPPLARGNKTNVGVALLIILFSHCHL